MYEKEAAGFGKRFLACIVDGLLFVPIYTILLILHVSKSHTEMIVNILHFLYFLIVPAIWLGFTVGKRVLEIQIIRIDGEKITLWTTCMRHLIAVIVYTLTLGIGFIISAFMVGLREDKRAIHDFIAGTQVVEIEEELY
ncbi:RDD family protein [Bacillus bingmayongensis]|uniref:RDD family protein n=1 Tax=Bacillus bingmayongensis TaxID=1150157 RepID=UPI00030552CB|nr:RDD family protein [Bacillus bingmayongensis]MBY0595065.1 RDD family protein [Bacillus bingmayongensis]